MKKLWKKLKALLLEYIEEQNREADAARQAETVHQGASADPAPTYGENPHDTYYREHPLGLASCWHGPDASERMMNVLSPRMSDETFGKRLAWMKGKGCTAAHLFLINQGDGEAAGYKAWDTADSGKMRKRWDTIRAAGLTPIPWIIADDSKALASDLFSNTETRVKAMAKAGFFEGVPLVVLGLEMDEYGSDNDWGKLREAVRKFYKGPLGVHHTSGNGFKYAKYGDVICGQLNPGCSEAQVKAQIQAILKLGKRAIGFEYSRGPDKALSTAALKAGAEGCGNWDGGSLPTTNENSVVAPAPAQSTAEDAVDFGQLEWAYGGFKGGGAKIDAKARILNLTVKADGMSYKWLAGGCENLGASSREDYSHTLACLFVLVSGRWRGGKFDWISTSRTSRDFANIKDSYNGWPSNSIAAAEKYAFVIVSADGKKRTNVISCGR